MNTAEMKRLCKEHTMYTWSAAAKVDPLPIARAEGIYIEDLDGNRFAV